MNIRSYHVKHRLDLKDLLAEAQKVADFAVERANIRKHISTKEVKDINLPATIKCQILRKYGRGTIKKATNVNLIIPNAKTKYKDKYYNAIDYNNNRVYLKPLKLSFNWNAGQEFEEIKQVEIDSKKFMICATFKRQEILEEFNDVMGIDLNCGIGRHIAVIGDLKTNKTILLGKNGPNIRKKYSSMRKKQKIKGNKEHRIMKDLDHKISRAIVNYALKHKLKIIMEDLKGIRKKHVKGNGLKGINRVINSWSFYRLRSFVEYKAKECNIPFLKVPPHYTSQMCSYCDVIGDRKSESFICNNKKCESFKKIRHSDINASFNIAKRGAKAFQ